MGRWNEYYSCWVCGWHGDNAVYYDDPYCGRDPHCPCCNAENIEYLKEKPANLQPLPVHQFTEGQTVYLVWGESCTKGEVKSIGKHYFSILWEGKKVASSHIVDDPRLSEKPLVIREYDDSDYESEREYRRRERCEWE